MFAIATDELSETTLALAASAAFPKSPELAKGADRNAAAKSDLMSPMYASRRDKTIFEYSLAFEADKCPNTLSPKRQHRPSNVSNTTSNNRVCKESVNDIKAIWLRANSSKRSNSSKSAVETNICPSL
jgi:hypothetical protein